MWITSSHPLTIHSQRHKTSSAMSELWHYIMQVPCGPTGLRSEPLLAVCRCCWHCASVTTAWRSTSACRTWPPSTSKSSSLRHRTPDFIWTFAYLRSATFRGGTFCFNFFFICTNREVLLFDFLWKWSEQDLWPCSYSRTRFFPRTIYSFSVKCSRKGDVLLLAYHAIEHVHNRTSSLYIGGWECDIDFYQRCDLSVVRSQMIYSINKIFLITFLVSSYYLATHFCWLLFYTCGLLCMMGAYWWSMLRSSGFLYMCCRLLCRVTTRLCITLRRTNNEKASSKLQQLSHKNGCFNKYNRFTYPWQQLVVSVDNQLI